MNNSDPGDDSTYMCMAGEVLKITGAQEASNADDSASQPVVRQLPLLEMICLCAGGMTVDQVEGGPVTSCQ